MQSGGIDARSEIVAASDSTGHTVLQMLRAALHQFPGFDARIRRITNVRSEEDVRQLMIDASPSGSFVVYTFVQDRLRECARQYAYEFGVTAIDLIGPILQAIEKLGGIESRDIPGGKLDETHFAMLSAFYFAKRHDDGQSPEGLLEADVVLLGLSRSNKTPISKMLADRDLSVANVPLVLGATLPPELSRVPAEKMVVLRMRSDRLRANRAERSTSLQMEKYVDPDYIAQEQRMVDELVAANPRWMVIDVTGRAAEAVSGEIFNKLKSFVSA